MTGYNDIAVYYNTLFSLIQHHKYSLEDLENMMPFEREVYVTLLIQHLEEEKQKYEQKKNA